MIKKNWMIRTKDFYLLGPISKKKLIELYQSGSLRSTDEVCSGNGYWFSISEKDLLGKYVLADHVQGFNPISEAKTVFKTKEEPFALTAAANEGVNETKISTLPKTLGEEKEEVLIPSDEDLAYPSDEEIDKIKQQVEGEVKNSEHTSEIPEVLPELPPIELDENSSKKKVK